MSGGNPAPAGVFRFLSELARRDDLSNTTADARKEDFIMPTQQRRSVPSADDIWILLREVSENQKKFQENQKKFQKEWAEIQKKAAAERKIREKELAEIQKKAAAERKAREKEAAEERKAREKELAEERKAREKELTEARKIREKEAAEERKIREKELAELRKETEESERKMNAAINKTNGKFDNMWGQLVESLVKGNLVKLFQSKGLKVDRCCTNDQGFIKEVTETGEKKRTIYEADIIVKNSEECVAVEVKSALTKRKVKRFLSVLKRFHQIFPEYSHLEVYGAITYLRTRGDAATYAEEQGLFVIKATGDSSHFVNKENFQAKTFCKPV